MRCSEPWKRDILWCQMDRNKRDAASPARRRSRQDKMASGVGGFGLQCKCGTAAATDTYHLALTSITPSTYCCDIAELPTNCGAIHKFR